MISHHLQVQLHIWPILIVGDAQDQHFSQALRDCNVSVKGQSRGDHEPASIHRLKHLLEPLGQAFLKDQVVVLVLQ
jgi:hypothetical protein